MMQSVLIFGVTSSIAESVGRIYAARGARLYLVARNSEKLNIIRNDYLARGAGEVHTYVMDANNYSLISELLDEVWQVFGKVDVALIAHGTLPDQARCEIDMDYSVQEFRTNGESVIAFLTSLSERFRAQEGGVISAIGSVAGDRGRASNYLYGAAKGSVAIYLSGLRGHLRAYGVHVLTIKPGFVDTPMTRNLALPRALVISAERAAECIVSGIERRRDIIYVPWFWRIIMLLIIHIPSALFKRMKC